ncbi:hypothetical protein E4T56_gene19290 [Termitomyces sp. T112]|nr:hypothetical protein E4T56_gene19290 [Termitomyces sp. T112]
MEGALPPPFHAVPCSGQQPPPSCAYSLSASPHSGHPHSVSPTTGDLHGCGCSLTTPCCSAVVLEMQEAQALCMALSSGPGDNQSNGGAPEEKHRGEFGGICELELLDEAIEAEDQIYITTVHLPPSIVEIRASQTMSQRLAQAFAANAAPQEFWDMVLLYLHAFKDVFSKASFDSLLECNMWDHAIKLLPNSAPSSCKVYPLAPREQDELDAFLQENLDSSCIYPSKSPMTSLVFFIKKKDGSL